MLEMKKRNQFIMFVFVIVFFGEGSSLRTQFVNLLNIFCQAASNSSSLFLEVDNVVKRSRLTRNAYEDGRWWQREVDL